MEIVWRQRRMPPPCFSDTLNDQSNLIFNGWKIRVGNKWAIYEITTVILLHKVKWYSWRSVDRGTLLGVFHTSDPSNAVLFRGFYGTNQICFAIKLSYLAVRPSTRPPSGIRPLNLDAKCDLWVARIVSKNAMDQRRLARPTLRSLLLGQQLAVTYRTVVLPNCMRLFFQSRDFYYSGTDEQEMW